MGCRSDGGWTRLFTNISRPTLSNIPNSNRCDSEKSPTSHIEQHHISGSPIKGGVRIGGNNNSGQRTWIENEMPLAPDRMGCGNVGGGTGT